MPSTRHGLIRTTRVRGRTTSGADRSLVRGAVLGCLALALTGCGNAFFWQQPGRTQAEFEGDSAGCATEARSAPKGADMEKVYRVCMRAKGWQRVKAETPAPNQFRGPESDEEMVALPSARSAPNEDAAATKCRMNTNWDQSRTAALTEFHQCLRAR